MSFYHLNKLLLLLWQLSTVYIIPLIMYLYLIFIDNYLYSFTFSELDQGQNTHKLVIAGFYLCYLLIWKKYNKPVNSLLNNLKYH
ncbi:MAG TPA: hypothetical protein EYH12_00505 [Psychromonas hadalis]|nr:hypothetical protein [Psychromonas hadalis]